MNRGKLILVVAAALILVGAAATLCIQSNKINKLQKELEITTNNYKVLDEENSELKTTKRNLQFTISQLDNAQDSLVKEMNKVKKQLNIKDKEIQNLSYIASQAHKADTLRLTDTLFVKDAHIDTTVVDSPWYSCNIKLDYPGSIVVSPTFNSEKYIVTHLSKETLKPAKKCKLLRLFQKKVTVVETEVVEKNPYITTERTKFINIVK